MPVSGDIDATELVVPALNADKMEARAGMEVRSWSDEARPREALQRALDDLDALWTPVLAADAAMRADALPILQEVAQPARSIRAANLMAGLRIQRSESEIAALARAVAQADWVMMIGIEACQPGVTERQVAQQMAQAFRYEPLWISASNTQVLEPGTVLSVEPGIYPPGRLGVRIEDIVVMTDGPRRCLTGLDRALTVKDL